MMNQKKILVMPVILVILVVAVTASLYIPNLITQNAPLKVISRNMTICGYNTGLVLTLFQGYNMTSITIPPGLPCFPKLNVDLIIYRGNYYYDGNYTYTDKNQEQITHHLWLTNSTIYCISPKVEGYDTCP
jgi:hypothetical protein